MPIVYPFGKMETSSSKSSKAGKKGSRRLKTVTTPTNPVITRADFPRLALLGPSTAQRNTNGTNDTPNMFGFASTGPYMWALRTGIRFDHRIVRDANTPFFLGDNYGREGAEFTEILAQCDAVVADYTSITNKWVSLAPGRNAIQSGMNAADFMTNVQTCLNKLIAGGFTQGTNKILLEGIWKKSSSYGSPWNSGGAARTTADAVNAQMAALAATIPNVIFLDLQTGMADPASPIGDPYSDAYVTDYTHYTPKGAQRAGKLIRDQLAPYLVVKTYPAADSNNKFPAFAGTSGTLVNGATGTVLTGYEVTKEASGNAGTVVASTVQVDGKNYQRISITTMDTAAALSESAQFRITANGAITHGQTTGTLVAFRARIIIAPTNALVGLSMRATDLGTNGRQTSAIALAYGTGQSAQAAQAGPALSSPALFLDATNGLDLWLESPALAVVGGSTIRPLIAIRYGPSAGTTIQADIGEWMSYVIS